MFFIAHCDIVTCKYLYKIFIWKIIYFLCTLQRLVIVAVAPLRSIPMCCLLVMLLCGYCLVLRLLWNFPPPQSINKIEVSIAVSENVFFSLETLVRAISLLLELIEALPIKFVVFFIFNPFYPVKQNNFFFTMSSVCLNVKPILTGQNKYLIVFFL